MRLTIVPWVCVLYRAGFCTSHKKIKQCFYSAFYYPSSQTWWVQSLNMDIFIWPYILEWLHIIELFLSLNDALICCNLLLMSKNCSWPLKTHLWHPSDSPGSAELKTPLPSDFAACCLSSKNVFKSFPIFLKLTTLTTKMTGKCCRQKWEGRRETERVYKEMLEASTSLHGSSAEVFQVLAFSNSPKILQK